MNETERIIAERIQLLIKKYNFSQVILAEKCELSKSTVSKAAKRGKLSLKSAKRIARALGVSLDYLYGNSEIENAQEYAFSLMEQHVSAFARNMSGPYNGIISGISLSPAFRDYLEKSAEIKKAPLSKRVCEDGLCEVKQTFLQKIGECSGDNKDYVLIDYRFYTPDVESAIKKAIEEIKLT